jgi:hypothetical protein
MGQFFYQFFYQFINTEFGLLSANQFQNEKYKTNLH